MKYLFSFFLLTVISLNLVQAKAPEQKGELTWYNKLDEAQKISNAQNKPIFAFFTGSDWCGWCHKLQREVFAKKEFIEWAKKNVVLLELDFPRSKPMPEDITKQNSELQQFFRVQGYPTVWLFFVKDDPATKKKNIEALGSQGYPQNATPGREQDAFISEANTNLSKMKKAEPAKKVAPTKKTTKK